MKDLKKRVKAIEMLSQKEQSTNSVPNQVSFMMNPDGPEISNTEMQNRNIFKNYVPKGNIEYSPSYKSNYDTSMDRPMVFLGMGANQREVSTDLIRKIIDENPQYFKGIDQSNYRKLQESLQQAYRSGDVGVNILDNLVLRSQGADPTGRRALNMELAAASAGL